MVDSLEARVLAGLGEQGIRDVVRAVLAEHGNSRQRWPMERVVAVVDAGTGTTVMSELYAAHAGQRGDVDLDALFARLGVVEGEDALRIYADALLDLVADRTAGGAS